MLRISRQLPSLSISSVDSDRHEAHATDETAAGVQFQLMGKHYNLLAMQIFAALYSW